MTRFNKHVTVFYFALRNLRGKLLWAVCFIFDHRFIWVLFSLSIFANLGGASSKGHAKLRNLLKFLSAGVKKLLWLALPHLRE